MYESAGADELERLLAAPSAGTHINSSGLSGTCRYVGDIVSTDLLDVSCFYCPWCEEVIDRPDEAWSGQFVCDAGHALIEGLGVERCAGCTCPVLD